MTDENEGDDEEDLEATKAMMERLRREARGEPVLPSKLKAGHISGGLVVPTRKLGAFTSSSLTDLPPTTQPRSSSPPKSVVSAPVSIDEETMPIKSARNTGRSRKLLLQSDDEDDDLPFPKITNRRSSPPPSSPPRTQLSTTEQDNSDSEASAKSSSPTPRISRKSIRRIASTSSVRDSEDDDRRDTVGDFVASIVEENKRDAEKQKKIEPLESQRDVERQKVDEQPSLGPIGLFDDEDEESDLLRSEKGHKRKPMKVSSVDLESCPGLELIHAECE